MSSDLTIIIPTVDGREEHRARLAAAILNTAPDAHVHWYSNYPTCGEVWNIGAREAETPLITMLADDLEPTDGWWEAALETVNDGAIPAPYLWTCPAGTFESGGAWAQMLPAGSEVAWAAVPFLRREWWIDIPPIHYFSDNAYTDAQRITGRPAHVTPRFAFRHWWASEGRQPMHGPQWYREEGEWSSYRQGLLDLAAGRA